MIIDLTTLHKSVSQDQRSIAEMISEIRVHYEALDLRRRHMFIEWLRAHSSRVKTATDVLDGLTAWFETMPHENHSWEYRLVMTEINWWNHLDEQTLTKILVADLTRNGAR